MNVEIRPAAPDELLAALRPIWLYMGEEPVEERAQGVLRFLEPDRLHAAFDGPAPVGGAGAFSFELTVPGGCVPAAGVTVVGVMPTHRRRGVLTAMMRAQLEDVHRRGEPVAVLGPLRARSTGASATGLRPSAARSACSARTAPSALRSSGPGDPHRGRARRPKRLPRCLRPCGR
jgi:GNAT superfamily N-acetyltransferase